MPSAPAPRAVERIVGRVRARREDLSHTMVARYVDQVVDYATLDEFVLEDVRSISLHNLDALLEQVEHGDAIEDRDLVGWRQGAARRVHQGVSLDSHLHAYRVWGETVWEAVSEAVEFDNHDEERAGLYIARMVIRHMNLASTAVASAYLDKLRRVWSDREVLQRDLLDELIAGHGASTRAAVLADALDVTIASAYVVLAVGGAASPSNIEESVASRLALLRAADSVKTCFTSLSGSLITGIRRNDLVVLCPASSQANMAATMRCALRLASLVAPDRLIVGVGAMHSGLDDVGIAYAEAKEAATIGIGRQVYGTPVRFDDVVMDSMLRSSSLSQRLADGTIGALQAYDASKGADFVGTLRAYIGAGFNLTKAAKELYVHPNTVVYRLKRIKELTGRDPHDPDDMILLAVAMRAADQLAHRDGLVPSPTEYGSSR